MPYTLLDYSSIGNQVGESRDAFGNGVEQKARLLNVLVACSLLFQLPHKVFTYSEISTGRIGTYSENNTAGTIGVRLE